MTAPLFLSRTRIGLRTAKGLEFVDAYVAAGLAIVAAAEPDGFATRRAEEAHAERLAEVGRAGDDASRRALAAAPPRPVTIDGFVLAHAGSGRRLTPAGWVFRTFDDARACLGALLAAPGGLQRFDGSLAAIEQMSRAVLEAHRAAGCFCGAFDHLRRMDAAIDESAYAAALEGLRKQPACDRWRGAHEEGERGW